MAVADNIQNAAERINKLTLPRQLMLMFGLAASIAIGVGVVLWSREPSYMPLYGQLDQRDANDVLESLRQDKVRFKIDPTTGQILVPSDAVQSARLKLAAQGLPREHQGATFDFLNQGNSFSYSQFMENARYKLALEKELARTITQFHDIKAARVHLAIPRESAFVRDSKKPSASVFIDTYGNRDVGKQTVSSIINLVASSIASMSANRVTVVDQNGKLLSEGAGNGLFSQTDRYLDYRQTIETQYARKIEDILTPILGFGRVNAKVSADIDFTSHEQTQEIFNPDQSAIRSEQKMVEKSGASLDAQGIPGALSNTPPGAGNLLPRNNNANNNQANVSNNEQETSTSFRQQSTKNFEVDKTISHTRNNPGSIRRLSVAVLVDDREVMDEKEKKMVKKPLTKEEIDQVKALVTDAIGLDPKRGDSLNVINSHFIKPEPIKPMPEESFWKKPFFWSIVKQFFGAMIILILIFGLLRPLFKTLATDEEEKKRLEALKKKQKEEDVKELPNPVDYEGQIALLRQIVGKEPKRVAQVVKNWVEKG